MRRILPFVALLLLVSALSWADEWNKTFTITGKPDLRVSTSDANIQVDTWAQNTIEVRVTTEGYKIGPHGIEINANQNGDAVELEVRYPHHNFSFNIGVQHHRVDVTIRMPREGRVDLRTGDGNIRLAGFKGEMEIGSGDGRQEIESVDGSLRAHAGDGRIHASGRFDALDISTGDGRIEAIAQSGSTVQRNWELHAGDGSVTLEVPENLAADVDLHTSDGHIDIGLPITVEGRLGGHSVQGKLNGGGNRVTIHTGDGSIHFQRS
jgi:DUF4097 and DUF4098 domain-containing protein YvlB